MKRLILALFLVAFSGATFGQVMLFGHGPNNYFSHVVTADKTIGIKDFLWSFDAVVTGAQISFDKDANALKTEVLAGAGVAAGYKHVKMAHDSSAISDWGLNLAVLTNVKLNEEVQTHLEVALLANVYNLTFGPAYIFKENKLAFVVGATIKF